MAIDNEFSTVDEMPDPPTDPDDRDESGGLTSLEEWEGRLRGYAGSLREGLSGRHEVAGVMENIADKILARRLRRGREGDRAHLRVLLRVEWRDLEYGFVTGWYRCVTCEQSVQEKGARHHANEGHEVYGPFRTDPIAEKVCDALTAQGEPGEDEAVGWLIEGLPIEDGNVERRAYYGDDARSAAFEFVRGAHRTGWLEASARPLYAGEPLCGFNNRALEDTGNVVGADRDPAPQPGEGGGIPQERIEEANEVADLLRDLHKAGHLPVRPYEVISEALAKWMLAGRADRPSSTEGLDGEQWERFVEDAVDRLNDGSLSLDVVDEEATMSLEMWDALAEAAARAELLARRLQAPDRRGGEDG